MPLSSYSAAADRLLSLADFERKSRAGEPPDFHLRRMGILLSRIGNPHLATPTVHVAGSKGKGSTATLVASVLVAHGAKVGLYTSPHLHTLCERIRVDMEPIAPADFAGLVDELWPHVEAVAARGDCRTVSVFEMLTTMAFVHFQRAGANFQVIEVGLGGRLDATNLVRPEVTAVTPVSLDHVRILGDTIPKIAAEKAGIFKLGAAAISGRQTAAALEVLHRTAAETGAPFTNAMDAVSVEREEPCGAGPQRLTLVGRHGRYDLALPLLGAHQVDNARTAVAVLEELADRGFPLRAEAVARGVAGTEWPARAQLLPGCVPPLLVDGAHNDASAGALLDTVRRHFPAVTRIVLIFAGSGGHDFAAAAQVFSGFSPRIVVTQTRHPKAVPADRVADALLAAGIAIDAVAPDAQGALKAARRLADDDDLIIAAGSLFLAAEIVEDILGVEPELYPDLRGSSRRTRGPRVYG